MNLKSFMNAILSAGALAFVLCVALSKAIAQKVCPEISTEDQTRLTKYVSSKYEVPASVKLSVKSATAVSDDCYRKVVFAGQGPLGEIALSLFLSPDFRYLSKELMDSLVEPNRERYEKARKTMSELTQGDPLQLGDPRAPVTLVIFSDFECPFCKHAAEMIRSESLIREGKAVRVVFRNYPLSQHPWAEKAAEMAVCVSFQNPNAFWQLHDLIFARQPQIKEANAEPTLRDFLRDVQGIDEGKSLDCVDRQLSLGVVLRDKALGDHLGVEATPTVFINGEVAHFSTAEELHALLVNQLAKQTKVDATSNVVAVF